MSAARLLLAVGGMILWISAFASLYLAVSLGCAAGTHRLDLFGGNALVALLVAVFLVHLAPLVGLQWYSLLIWRGHKNPARSSGFLAALTCLVTAVSIVSLVFIGLPVLMVPPCV